jgi:hypothetical protein
MIAYAKSAQLTPGSMTTYASLGRMSAKSRWSSTRIPYKRSLRYWHTFPVKPETWKSRPSRFFHIFPSPGFQSEYGNPIRHSCPTGLWSCPGENAPNPNRPALSLLRLRFRGYSVRLRSVAVTGLTLANAWHYSATFAVP